MSPRPLRLRDVAAITFDCYGTLIDWEEGARGTLRALLARRDARADESLFFERWERAQWEHIQRAYAPYREITAQSFLEVAAQQGLPLDASDARAFADSISRWAPFPDVSPALARLRQKGFLLGIISNIDDAILAESVTLLGVEFSLLLTAEQARAYKPSPLPFQRALEKLQLPAEQVAHAAFGFEYDISTASQLGFRTILVRRRRARFPPAPLPDLVVADLQELVALLE